MKKFEAVVKVTIIAETFENACYELYDGLQRIQGQGKLNVKCEIESLERLQ